MPKIPIQSLVSARQSGVQLQPGVFQQSARATAELLSSVVGAGEMVKAQFDKAQDLRNKSDISEKRREIREAQGVFQNRMLQENMDPAQWGPQWQDELKRIEGSLDLRNSKTPGVVRRALSEDFQNFAGSSFIQISGAALKENRKRAKQNFDRDLDYLIGEEDYDGANALVADSTGDVLTSEEAGDLNRTVGSVKKKRNLEHSRNLDPIEHLRLVKNGDFADYQLPKVQQQREIEATEREIKKREADAIHEINLVDDAGLIVDENDLKTRLNDDPYISEKTAKAYVKNYRSNQPLSRDEQFGIQDRIDANVRKFQTDPSYTQKDYAAEWNAIQLEVDTFGSRTGAGAFKADLHNLRPSLFSEGKMDEASAKKRIKELVPITTTANALVKERAEGMASIEFARQKDTDDVFTSVKIQDQAILNATTKKDLDERAILYRSAMQRAVGEFIASFPNGEIPTEPDLKGWMDKNADRINLEVREDPANIPVLEVEVLSTAEKQEVKANKWLENPPADVNPLNPLLPPKP